MSTTNYQAADFASALHALMPRGLVWPRDPTSVMAQVVAGLAPTWARHTAANNYLLVDAFPATAVELLPEWEATLGLPDPCAGESPMLQGRQQQVVARLTNSGGQSIPYFIAYAQALGYTVTVAEFTPSRANQSRCGDPCNGIAWAYAWAVVSALSAVTYARASQSMCGEPLAYWNNAVLECELKNIMPAHSTLLFQYLTAIYDNSVVTASDQPVVMADGSIIITS